MYAVTCGTDDALYYYDEFRGTFCKIASGYGCLGNSVQVAQDGSLYAVSQRRRRVLRVRGGHATVVAGLPRELLPVAAGVDSRQRVYVLVNRATPDSRQAEVHRVDERSGNVTLLGAVGGALGDSLVVSQDTRLFFTDPSHHALFEVDSTSFMRAEALQLIHDGLLRSGAAHAGGAAADAEPYGHAEFVATMLYGTAQQAVGGGVAAFLTPNYDTEVALLADAYSLRSLTAERFVDTWPLPQVPNQARFLGARNIAVAPARGEPGADGFRNRSVLITDWASGNVAELTGFAPHVGDFRIVANWFGLGAPYGAVLLSDNSRYVADFAGDRVVNVATGTTVHVGSLDGPVGLAASADESELYVSEYRSGRIVAIDLASRAVREVAVNLTQPEGIALSPLDGWLAVIESGGARRLLEVNPAARNEVREVGRKLPSAGDSEPTHPRTMAGVAWTDARVVDDDVEFGARSAATLYVTLDGDGTVRRYLGLRRADDPHAKPCDRPELFAPHAPVREADGRLVVTLELFGSDLPELFAVADGTWLRIKAHRLDAIHRTGSNHTAGNPNVKEVVGVRLLESDDIDGFPATLLYPSDLNQEPHQLEVQLTARGQFAFRDAKHPDARAGSVLVYDAAYDDPESYKYAGEACPEPLEAPPAPEAEPPCRTEIECALGYRGNGTMDERGCYVGELRCLPVAKTKLGVLQQDLGQ